MRKLMLLVAAGVGYVLGARAGRERYDQIRGAVTKVRNDPRVQEKTQQAVDLAKQQAPVVADKVTLRRQHRGQRRHVEGQGWRRLAPAAPHGRTAGRPAVGVTPAGRARRPRWRR